MTTDELKIISNENIGLGGISESETIKHYCKEIINLRKEIESLRNDNEILFMKNIDLENSINLSPNEIKMLYLAKEIGELYREGYFI